MNDRTRKVVVFSALPIALIWGYYNIFMKKSADKSAYAPTEPAPTATAPALIPAMRDSSKLHIESIIAQPWRSDPFRMSANRSSYQQATVVVPPTIKKADLTWVLNGIIYSETSPFAYINHKSVKVGDIVNTAKVIAIERKAVTLEVNGNPFKISLSKDAQS